MLTILTGILTIHQVGDLIGESVSVADTMAAVMVVFTPTGIIPITVAGTIRGTLTEAGAAILTGVADTMAVDITADTTVVVIGAVEIMVADMPIAVITFMAGKTTPVQTDRML